MQSMSVLFLVAIGAIALLIIVGGVVLMTRSSDDE